MPGSDSLAAEIRPCRRRRRRRIVIDGLPRFGGLLGSGLVVVLHAFLEGLDALRDIAHQVRNLAAAEQQQDHCDHDDPVPNAKRTHPATLQKETAGIRPKLCRKVGPGGVKNKDLGRGKSLSRLRIIATVNPLSGTKRNWM